MSLSFLVVVVIFLQHSLHTESRKVSPGGVVYGGFKENAFHRITTHLIETSIVNKLGLCAFKCMKSVECLSFNFGNPVKGTHVCELLRTDKYNARSSYISNNDFHYFFAENKCMDLSRCLNNGSCYPDYENDDYNCVCLNGVNGRNCEISRRGCVEILTAGFTADGVYYINPDRQGLFPVFCDMTTDSGGWTVFHKRFDGSVDFNRGWQDYRNGFGDLNGEFWLGNDKIHRLTANRQTRLRVELQDMDGVKAYATYSSFAIASESDSYRLAVSGYAGTAGDSLIKAKYSNWICNGMQFSTPDNDNDKNGNGNCAKNSGWWFRVCAAANLNSIYGGIVWRSFGHNLKEAKMKFK